ncbi:MAG TPA: DUF1015 domain-containing protein [Candidatus Eisenbergiella merdipullorum]|uniref:DUF1015 domain-containing protein n=1 Tax=Candidatus Eisenbergiella merdipullorum TaxID=2838553 RepID=A0A9D2I365_9FIRM|nr:DUF1015 domain-containing protein [Candidatus Eisenbergiella merdipullorum]
MAEVRPFRAWRPAQELAERIAALPYDVVSTKEAKEETAREPYSFLAVDRPETQFEDGMDATQDRVYERAGDLLGQRMKEGSFRQEEKPCYYIYELERLGHVQTGIAACVSVDDYLNGVIRRHENTRKEKEDDRTRHVKACEAQTGPVFLAYRATEEIAAVTKRCRQEPCLYDFCSPDGIRHRVWRIGRQDEIEALHEAFGRVKRLYIADGHHRCASAVRVAQEYRKEHPDHTGEEPYNYILSVLFPDDQLTILEYNRVIRDLNGMTPREFLQKIGEKFEITPMEGMYRPERKGLFGLYLKKTWYRLTPKEGAEKGRNAEEQADPAEQLDVAVLQRLILEPVLGITDPRTDERIDFVGGVRGLKELEKRCEEDCAAAFSLYPTSIEELFAVADAGLLMPPKSTWFEPKLRSGLFIHSLKDR